MQWNLAGTVLGAALAAGGSAHAHHSVAMFDQHHPIELEGVVREFRFSAPHAFILLDVKQQDGNMESWNLEGATPSALVREGWSETTIKPGDEIRVIVLPLRNGAPGGAWHADKAMLRDGRPLGPAIPLTYRKRVDICLQKYTREALIRVRGVTCI